MLFHCCRMTTCEHIKMAEERIQKRGTQKYTQKWQSGLQKRIVQNTLRKGRRGRKGVCMHKKEGLRGY